MSLFSSIFKGVKKLARQAASFVLPAVVSTIPVIGPIASQVLTGLGGLAGGPTQRGPPRGLDRARTLPGVGAVRVGPPVSRAGQRRVGDPRFAQVQVPSRRTTFEQRPGTTTQPARIGQMSIFAAIPGIIRAGTQIAARAARTPGGRAVVLGTAAAAATDIVLDEFGQPVARKRRRMNFSNGKAARRAIRRIKGTRKLLQDIEKQLPRRAAPRRRRDLGPGHEHVR